MTFFTSSGPNVAEVSKYFLNLHRHQWTNIHLLFAAVFTTFLLLHLILEWKWIKGKTIKLFGSKQKLILWLILPFILIFLGWCFTPKNTNRSNSNKYWRGNKRQGRLSKKSQIETHEVRRAISFLIDEKHLKKQE